MSDVSPPASKRTARPRLSLGLAVAALLLLCLIRLMVSPLASLMRLELAVGDNGAIVLANADDDDGDGLPDNWPGGDLDYVPGGEPTDESVNAWPDPKDLTTLALRRPGLGAIPKGVRIVLRVAQPEDEAAYFQAIPAHERLRIFLPTHAVGKDLVIQPGDEALIGPVTGPSVTFAHAPTPPEGDIALLAGAGALHLGVEGIRYGAAVDISLQVWYGPLRLRHSRARVQVAPLILFEHQAPIATDVPRGPSVIIEDLGDETAAMRARLRDLYPGGRLAEVEAIDRWHQDGYEIGYTQAPYGAMWVVLGLPRGQLSQDTTSYGAVRELLALPKLTEGFDPETMRSQNAFTRQHLLGPGVGIITDFQDIPFGEADAGGNLEAVPGGPARFLYGANMQTSIIQFLEAQGVQRGVPVDTSLFAVGHVDELFSYCPDGAHVLVADAEMAWALLLIANELDPSARMLQDMLPYDDAGVAVGALIGGAASPIRAFNLLGVMAPDGLPALWASLGIASAAGTPVADPANRGTASLRRGGPMVGFVPDGSARVFRLTFVDGERFTVDYQVDGAEAWIADGEGARSRDFVAPSRTAFVLAHWWEGGAPIAGDRFQFTVDPGVPWVQIPVLYRDYMRGMGVPLTSNHVNALVDGESIITAQAHGPVVDLGSGPVDILGMYVHAELVRAGYREIVWVDERSAYHNHTGSVHCATNIFRQIPDRGWWE